MNNSHLMHLEESVWKGSQDAIEAIDTALSFCECPADHHYFLTEKVDGAPAFLFGIDNNGFFVSSKNSTGKFYDEHAIANSNLSAIYKKVLTAALAINNTTRIKTGVTYRADCLHFDGTATDWCRANLIRYVNEGFKGKQFVACVHTNLTSIEELDKFEDATERIYLFSNAIPRCLMPTHVNVPNHLLYLLEACKTRLNSINYVAEDKQDECILRIRNSMLKNTGNLTQCFFNDIHQVAEELYIDKATDKNRYGRWLNWLRDHKDLIQTLLITEQLLIRLKELIMYELNRVLDGHLMESYLGDTDDPMSEGFVLTDTRTGKSYKLVDRTKFSMHNFRLHGDIVTEE